MRVNVRKQVNSYSPSLLTVWTGNGCLAASKPQVPNIGPAPKYFIGPTGYPGMNIASEHKYMIILSSRALRVDFSGVPIHDMSLKEQLLHISLSEPTRAMGLALPRTGPSHRIKLGPEI